ncbi:MAG: alpha-amylase family glycosyl hydrolase [Saprospiraceae bacterium]|nr:alpha-amylase family glycosyl hydrolase [Saprospiraceae bacterium]
MKYLRYMACLLLFGLLACQDTGDPETTTPNSAQEAVEVMEGKIQPPVWARNATIYELNIRQFTPEGTFQAIRPHLERLREMGIDIIWLMPIHPISQTRRKGTLGSYYAVDDFRAVNPEYGTMQDLEALIGDIHNNGMKVLLDWVPHHTGWDHPWIEEHPDWYSQDEEGNIIDPINEETGEPWGWTDVAELKLDNPEMRHEMISDMIYWISDVGIDGFRVDHAHGLPDDYWDEVSSALSQLDDDIFMLAEGEEPRLRNRQNFVMTYAWKFHHAMNAIARGEHTVDQLDSILAEDRAAYTYGYHMYFTSNHDENSWAGTVMERMGDGHQTFAVLAATIDGMPLVYSGQEEPIRKRLEFFEKDPIEWNTYAYADFYKTLFGLKKRNRALWNGEYGALSERINTSQHVYAFQRVKGDTDKVMVILNLSPEPRETVIDVDSGKMRDVFSGEIVRINAGDTVALTPWEYVVLSSK